MRGTAWAVEVCSVPDDPADDQIAALDRGRVYVAVLNCRTVDTVDEAVNAKAKARRQK